jgi:hypothetical protein
LVSSERVKSWPTETLGNEESPVPAKNEEKYTKIDIASLLSEKTIRTIPPPEQDVPGSAFYNESNLRSTPEIRSPKCSPAIQGLSIGRADDDGPLEIIASPDPTKAGDVREESKVIPNQCLGQQNPPPHSPAVATKHTDTDAQQTAAQECRASSMPCGLSIPTSSAERNINENIPGATSLENGDSRVGFDPIDNENSASLESPNIRDLAPSPEDGFDFDPADDWSSTTSLRSSVLDYPIENDRTYHKFKEGRYPLPNDPDEQERLDLQHHLFLLTFDQKLLLCPVDLWRVQRTLDLGAGTGIWAIEFAEDNPQSEVLGVDLTPIQPGPVLPNLRFEVADIESRVSLSLYSSYRLVAKYSVDLQVPI